VTVNYANRGKKFESLLDYTNNIYKQKGVALINKRPTPVQIIRTKNGRITQATYSKKSTVDYDGVFNGKPIVFEAKSTNGKSIPLNLIQDHQIDYLLNAEQHGAISFLIVHFKELDETYVLSNQIVLDYVENAKKGGRKSIPIKEFKDNGIKVESNDGVPLDYLGAMACSTK